MKKVLFLTNIPAPYRVDFFNALGKLCDLTVIFEAKRAEGIRFSWKEEHIQNFRAVFLSEGNIDETHVDKRIFAYLKQEKYDHIVATSYGYFTETAALLYLKAHRIPYYLELDGGVIRAGENPVKRILKRMILRGALGVFSSGKTTDSFLQYYGVKKERILRYPFTSLSERDILPACPTQEEKQKLRAALNIPYETMLLSVGQFIPRKGFDILLKAAAKLDRGVGIYIVGGVSEPTEEYLSLQKKFELHNVHFMTFIEREQLSDYYRAADVFVLPTREDVWGLVINEAMAYGLPVITTDRCVAGLELVQNGKNGTLVPIEDPDALQRAILPMVTDRTLCRTYGKASLSIIGSYTMEQMAKTHMLVFENAK